MDNSGDLAGALVTWSIDARWRWLDPSPARRCGGCAGYQPINGQKGGLSQFILRLTVRWMLRLAPGGFVWRRLASEGSLR